MKLLCWMHRKFRQNSHEALKALVIGQSSVDDQQYFPKTNYGTTTRRSFKQGQRSDHGQLRKSFTCLETVRGTIDTDDEDYEDDTSSAISELFHGFLAIGTLGSAESMAHIADPGATPTFSISVVENITAGKETEDVTENELKLINDELEKVLADDAFNDTSSSTSRNSHVSMGRSSHGSVITLSGKPEEGGGASESAVCPLQGYLFGSAIEMSETTATAAATTTTGGRNSNSSSNATKESMRTSLGELFQRSKAAEDGGWEKTRQPPPAEKEAERSAMNMMKKKIKKKMLHASSRNSSSIGSGAGGGPGGDHSAPAEKKLNKILHMFHRKVHPETSATVVKSGGKAQKTEQKKKTGHDGSSNYEGQVGPDEDIILCPERALFLKQKLRRYRSQSNPPHFTFTTIDSIGNREQWIRTDADYLVLEL